MKLEHCKQEMENKKNVAKLLHLFMGIFSSPVNRNYPLFKTNKQNDLMSENICSWPNTENCFIELVCFLETRYKESYLSSAGGECVWGTTMLPQPAQFCIRKRLTPFSFLLQHHFHYVNGSCPFICLSPFTNLNCCLNRNSIGSWVFPAFSLFHRSLKTQTQPPPSFW